MDPQGALYLFPIRGDVQDFSRGRFNPLINDTPSVEKIIKDTEAQASNVSEKACSIFVAPGQQPGSAVYEAIGRGVEVDSR